MENDAGFVCGRCDRFAALAATICPSCGYALGFGSADVASSVIPASVAHASLRPPSLAPDESTSGEHHVTEPFRPESAPSIVPSPLTEVAPSSATTSDAPFIGPVRIPAGFILTESLMEQARTYVCKNPICHTPVPPGHKFCGRCGESVPREILTAQTMMFSKMLEPGKAKLVVIKGEGISNDASDETAYLLGGKSHLAGRSDGQIVFDRDPWVSPRHANFYYRDDGKLVLRDEGSLNGIFVRVRQPIDLGPNDVVLAGEQVLRLESSPRATDQNDAEGTSFYSSPKRQSPFRVAQMLRGGSIGMLLAARESSVSVGRDNCDMNFPNDPFMSGKHCKIDMGTGGRFTLTDLNSKNGTYLRLRGEREMQHGDYIFIGRELLRVDISA